VSPLSDDKIMWLMIGGAVILLLILAGVLLKWP
jgi:uncharacterized protein involved in exopolysaccharide biosynthesis